jgi:hypothetical protein
MQAQKARGAGMSNNFIPLPEVPRHLREEGVAASYHTVWRRATEGQIPVERIGGRFFVRLDDLPQIARTLTKQA